MLLPRFAPDSLSMMATFWCRYSALYYGLVVLCAAVFALHGGLLPLVLFTFVGLPMGWFPGRPRRLFVLACFLFSFALLSIKLIYHCPDLPSHGIRGRGFFEPQSLSKRQGHQGPYYLYRGVLRYFEGEDGCKLQSAPVIIRVRSRGERPLADRGYYVRGQLRQLDSYRYLLKLDSEMERSSHRSWSLVELRFRAKEAVKAHLSSFISDPQARALLVGLATGELDDRLLRLEFGRLGVQHVLAISGFHFAILAAMLHFLLRPFLSRKALSLSLSGILSSYYLFLGSGPSIQRAWIAALVVLLGELLGRRPRSLNTLGIALLFVLLCDPLQCLQRGFQYSFLATSAILLVYPLTDDFLKGLFPQHRLFRPIYQHT